MKSNSIKRTFTISSAIRATAVGASLATLGIVAGGCSSTAQAAAPPSTANTAAQNGAPQTARVDPKPIDPAMVGAATGGKPETSDKVVKVSFPRNDLPVTI